MTVNLVNEQELNKFLTDYISEYNPEVKVSPLMMLSRKFIADNADDLAKAISAQWLKSKFRDYLSKEEAQPYLEPVTTFDEASPEWLKKAVTEGRPVVRFCPDKVTVKKIGELRLINRFAVMAAKNYIQSRLKNKDSNIRLDYLKRHGAFESIQKVWAAFVRVKKEREFTKGIAVVVEYGDGFKMAELQSRDAFVLEGNAMGHCVGYEDYFDRYKRGDIKVYSLRDERYRPHATIEVAGDTVVQVKGRADQTLRAVYAGYVQDFVKKQGLKVSADEQPGIGILEDNSRYYNLYDLPKYKKFKLKSLDLSESGLKKLPEMSNVSVSGTLDLSTTKIKNLKGCPKAVQLRLFDCNNLEKDCLKDLPEEVEVLEDFNLGIEALQYLPEKTSLRRVEFQEDDLAHDYACFSKLPLRLLAGMEFENVPPQFKEEHKKALRSCEEVGRLATCLSVMNAG